MIFLPRFRDDTLRRARGQTPYASLREQLSSIPANSGFGDINLDTLSDQQLPGVMAGYQQFERARRAALPRSPSAPWAMAPQKSMPMPNFAAYGLNPSGITPTQTSPLQNPTRQRQITSGPQNLPALRSRRRTGGTSSVYSSFGAY